mgnify:FL=1
MERVLLLILFFFIGITQQVQAHIIHINNEGTPAFYLIKPSAFVYDDSGEILGEIYKEQNYIYKKKTESCYYIEVENSVGCVPSSVVKEGTIKMQEEELDRSGKMVYTTKYAQLKDENGNILYTSQPNRRHYAFEKNDAYYYARVAGRIALLPKADVADDKGIPVLMYHHIVDHKHPKDKLSSTMITVKQLENNIHVLQQMHARTITMNDLYDFLQGQKNLGKNTVVLTFDDGLKSNIIYAYPLLKQTKMKATNFIITSRIPPTIQPVDKRILQFISLEEMYKSADVFSFEGHTHALHDVQNNKSHFILRDARLVKEDLQKSKSILPQLYFAYPFGQFNEMTKDILRETGYRLAFTTKNGYVKYGDDPYELKRIGIEPTTTINEFTNYLAY